MMQPSEAFFSYSTFWHAHWANLLTVLYPLLTLTLEIEKENNGKKVFAFAYIHDDDEVWIELANRLKESFHVYMGNSQKNSYKSKVMFFLGERFIIGWK